MSTTTPSQSQDNPLLFQQPIQQVAQFLGLPEHDWHELGGDIAGSSRTWLHPQWVLQQRPRQRYKRMTCLYNFSLQLDGLFRGLRYHGPMARIIDGQVQAADCKFLETDHFWMAQPRLDGHALFDHHMTPETLLYNLERSMPAVADSLELLSQQKLDFFPLYRSMPTSGLVQQNLKFSIISQLVDTDQRIIELARTITWDEPESHFVVSHGDPTLKNIVEHSGGIDLVDWESMWLLPRHRDFTHMVAFLAKTMHPKYWTRISQTVWHTAQHYLPDWDETRWQQAVVWQMLREVVYFPHGDQQQFDCYLDNLAGEISSLG